MTREQLIDNLVRDARALRNAATFGGYEGFVTVQSGYLQTLTDAVDALAAAPTDGIESPDDCRLCGAELDTSDDDDLCGRCSIASQECSFDTDGCCGDPAEHDYCGMCPLATAEHPDRNGAWPGKTVLSATPEPGEVERLWVLRDAVEAYRMVLEEHQPEDGALDDEGEEAARGCFECEVEWPCGVGVIVEALNATYLGSIGAQTAAATLSSEGGKG
jgi:hypothetical protein